MVGQFGGAAPLILAPATFHHPVPKNVLGDEVKLGFLEESLAAVSKDGGLDALIAQSDTAWHISGRKPSRPSESNPRALLALGLAV